MRDDVRAEAATLGETGTDLLRSIVSGSPVPEPGEWVALACPECAWTSSASQVIDQPNGAWFAFSAVTNEWIAHYRNHTPPPDRWVVEAPSGSGRSSRGGES